MAGMERFTQRARRVLSLAHQEAERTRNGSIGTEHLLLGLMDEEGGLAGRVLREIGLTSDRVREVITRVASPSNTSDTFDPNQVELAADAVQVLENSVEEARRLGHHFIGTEHILLGLIRVECTAMEVIRRHGVTVEQIRRHTRRLLNENTSSSTLAPTTKRTADYTTSSQQMPVLDRITEDLNSHAENYEYEFLAARPDVLKQITHVLLQRIQKNPMIIGQRGTGKTSIVHCLANSIVNGNVPLALFNRKILSLNFYGLISTVSQRNQLDGVVQSILASSKSQPFVLFLDNLGLYFENQDTSNWLLAFFEMLYSELIRGNIQIICTVDSSDYEKYIKGKQIFSKLFVPVYLTEPTIQEAIEILKAQRGAVEEHNHVIVSDEAINTVVLLAEYFMPDRYFPEKAFEILDAAATSAGPSNNEASELLKQLRDTRANRALAQEEGSQEDVLSYEEEEIDLAERLERLRTGWDRSSSPIVTSDDIVNALAQTIGLSTSEIKKYIDGLKQNKVSTFDVNNDKLLIFLCHAREDKTVVRQYYNRLKKEPNIEPWLDVEKLLPGMDWNLEIRSAVRSSDVVLVFLSGNSVSKKGYVQREITQALDIADELPEGRIFIIPLRLEDCEVPMRLKRWQWLDLFEEDSYDRLLASLRRVKDLPNKNSETE